jgi:hypothetical protein
MSKLLDKIDEVTEARNPEAGRVDEYLGRGGRKKPKTWKELRTGEYDVKVETFFKVKARDIPDAEWLALDSAGMANKANKKFVYVFNIVATSIDETKKPK